VKIDFRRPGSRSSYAQSAREELLELGPGAGAIVLAGWPDAAANNWTMGFQRADFALVRPVN